MKRKILCALLAGAVAVSVCSCKPATTETEEKVKDYESKLKALDLSGDTQEDSAVSGDTSKDSDILEDTQENSDFTGNTLKVQLSDNVSVDAVITPSAFYQGKIGIYEFERDDLGFEREEFIEKVNEYYGSQKMGYEEEPARINCYNDEHGGWGRYCQDMVNSENYYSFLNELIHVSCL